ncbi:hypothetical protein ABVT39_025062 [Epinephelus coioides]
MHGHSCYYLTHSEWTLLPSHITDYVLAAGVYRNKLSVWRHGGWTRRGPDKPGHRRGKLFSLNNERRHRTDASSTDERILIR